jgi:hypothetical protein
VQLQGTTENNNRRPISNPTALQLRAVSSTAKANHTEIHTSNKDTSKPSSPLCFETPTDTSHSQYNQQQYPGQPPAQQFPQQGAYPQDQYPPNQQAPNPCGQPGQPSYGPTDPGAQQEGDRGLMGALGGGAAGYFGGNKMGGHGIMGAIAGAVLGSKLEDKHKRKKHH